MRGLSSIGRAPALQAGGQEFDSPRLHEIDKPPLNAGVADAKYKIVSTRSSIPNDDVYQMVTYCTRYGLDKGYLLYASAQDFSIDVEGSSITIEVRGIDLSRKVFEIEEQVSFLLKEMLSGSGVAASG